MGIDHDRTRGRTLTVALAAALLMAACSGGSDSPAPAAAPGQSAPADESANAAGASEATADASTGGEAPEDFDYCRSGGEYYATISALNIIGDDDNAAARQIYGNVPAQLDVMIDTAPTPAVAATPQRIRASLTLLNEALASVDWDVDALNELPNAAELGRALTEVGAGTDEIEAYLASECGLDPTRLQRSAREVALSVATGPLRETDGAGAAADGGASTDGSGETTDDIAAEPAARVEKPPFDAASLPFSTVMAMDDTGVITSLVPESWSQVDGTSAQGVRQLFAAPDLDAFRSTFAAPGLSIVSGNFDNAGVAASNGFEALVGSLDTLGCSVGPSAAYSDGVYTGSQVTASCTTDGHPTYLISGVNAADDTFFLLVLAEGADFSGVYQAVTQTFRVD